MAQQPDEAVTQNNVRESLIEVRDRKEKILYFEGEPRFELKFLRRAVADDPNLQVVTLQRTADNKFLRLDVDGPEDHRVDVRVPPEEAVKNPMPTIEPHRPVGFGNVIAVPFFFTGVRTAAPLALIIALVFLYFIAAIFVYGGELNAANGYEQRITLRYDGADVSEGTYSYPGLQAVLDDGPRQRFDDGAGGGGLHAGMIAAAPETVYTAVDNPDGDRPWA